MASIGLLFTKSFQGAPVSQALGTREDVTRQAHFRLFRQSANKIGDFKAGQRVSAEAPWAWWGQRTRVQGGGLGNTFVIFV